MRRSTNVPVSIHSSPSCQPSTDGGLIRNCPIQDNCAWRSSIWRFGLWNSPVSLSTPVISSAGLFTLAYQQSRDLKKSDVNSTRSMWPML